MESKKKASLKRSYSDFEPLCKRKVDENSDIVEIHVPDFSKSELKVQINNRNTIIVTGEHQLDEAKWSRFHKEINIPKDCCAEEICAEFGWRVLTITMPKVLEFQKLQMPKQEKVPIVEEMINTMASFTFAGLVLGMLMALGLCTLGGLFCK